MAHTALPNFHAAAGRGALTRRNALPVAWGIWFFLLLVPYGVLPFALHGTVTGASNADLADRWFLGIMTFLAVGLPLALLVRSRLFKPYWCGKRVTPRAYVLGMSTLWLVLAVVGLTAELACLATATFAPNVLPALLALVVYLVVYPTGTAMAGRAGGSDHADDHDEPG